MPTEPKGRLSKLQRWILENFDKIPEGDLWQGSPRELRAGERVRNHTTFWIYQNFYHIKNGKETLKNFPKIDYFKGQYDHNYYEVPNKYQAVVSNSLKNMEKKGLISKEGRHMWDLGHTIFSRTDKGLSLSDITGRTTHLTIRKEQQSLETNETRYLKHLRAEYPELYEEELKEKAREIFKKEFKGDVMKDGIIWKLFEHIDGIDLISKVTYTKHVEQLAKNKEAIDKIAMHIFQKYFTSLDKEIQKELCEKLEKVII